MLYHYLLVILLCVRLTYNADMENIDLIDKRNEVVATKYAQGLVDDLFALRTNFGSMESIVRDILVFLAQKYEQDLFGFITFDVTEFAEALGYKKSTLQRDFVGRYSSPDKLPIPASYDGHQWVSYIEYALLHMLRLNVILSQEYKGKIHLKAHQLISELMVESGPRNKRTYKVKLGYFTSTSFFKEYVNIDYEKYTQIQKLQTRVNGGVGLSNLYLFLMKGYRTLGFNGDYTFSASVDMLSRIMDYTIDETNHKKRKVNITQALNKMVTILSDIGFGYSYEKMTPDSRFKYNVVFTFDDLASLKSNEHYHKFCTTMRNIAEAMYFETYHKAFYLANKAMMGPTSQLKEGVEIPKEIADEFAKWFSDAGKDEDIKERALCRTIYSSFKLVSEQYKCEADLLGVISRNNYFKAENTSSLKNIYDSLVYSHNRYQAKFSTDAPGCDPKQFTLLIKTNKLEEIKEIVSNGKAPYFKDYKFLNEAFENGNYKICEYLIEQGSYAGKEFIAKVEAKKDKFSRGLLSFILEFKNKEE